MHETISKIQIESALQDFENINFSSETERPYSIVNLRQINLYVTIENVLFLHVDLY